MVFKISEFLVPFLEIPLKISLVRHEICTYLMISPQNPDERFEILFCCRSVQVISNRVEWPESVQLEDLS